MDTSLANANQVGERPDEVKKPSVSISEIKFSGGDTLRFFPGEKVIIVGANNSGKSQTLKELMSVSSDGTLRATLIIRGLAFSKTGTADDLRAFLHKEAETVESNFRYGRWEIHGNHIPFWDSPYLIHGIAGGFIQNIDASNRLNICNRQKSVSPGQRKTMPQHLLYDDEALMKKISLLFRKAFGQDLLIDFRGGSQIPLHVGSGADVAGLIDRVGEDYVTAVRKFPLLEKQGDGMRSYAGILFEAIVSELDITLIDEPEAFLHPPQMRKLGETLASEVKGQLFVSTHSSDILRGFLEGTKGNIRIIRISRSGTQNFVMEASPEVVRETWQKPELRYSNALEGIFHEQTIICEDDSDCRLINSVADYISNERGEQWKDTAYVPTGGKHAVPKVAKILKAIGVPIKVVFDADFLSEKELVEKTVEAFGGDWRSFEGLWKRVEAAVRQGKARKTAAEIKAEIVDLLSKADVDDLPKRKIDDALKQQNAWSAVKRYGFRAIPNGDAQKDYNSLKGQLEGLGIYMIPVGEIEGFAQDIGAHGPKFVTELLATKSLGDDSLDELRSFVESVHTA